MQLEAAALTTLTLLASVLPCRNGECADWPNWRGINQAGIWQDVRLPKKLEPGNVQKRWSTTIGGGYCGIVVKGRRVLTMDRPADKKSERVVCLDSESGRLLWQWKYSADYGDLDYDNGPRATPTIAGDAVYTLGSTGIVHCLSLTEGKKLWSIDCESSLKARRPIWGHAAPVLVKGELVFLHIGGQPDATIVALDRKNGEVRWKALSDRPSYSPPLSVSMHGKPHLLAWTADHLAALAPESGRLLYKAAFKTSNYDVAIISPVPMGNSVFISGYWDGSAFFSIDKDLRPKKVWATKALNCLMATPLHLDDHLYALDKRDGLLCVSIKDGSVVWKDGHRMTTKERNPHASMVWGEKKSGRAVVLNARGDLLLARLSPKGYSEEGRVHLIDGRSIWSHPAFCGQDIFARSDTEIICVRISETAATPSDARRP